MSLSEFELIDRYFSHKGISRADVVLGIGDDAAILSVPQGYELVVTMDTLVAGVHFFEDIDPALIAYKALAVNLSDLAAMGAEPAWVTLSLTLSNADEVWLARFSEGFFELADQYQINLIGGDTSCGPLSVTVQAHGLLPEGKALRRNNAHPGDLIYVTGTLGDAGLALMLNRGNVVISDDDRDVLNDRLNRPVPRVAEGLFLRELANSAIDISDGLAADLKHILDASHTGASIFIEDIPLSNAFLEHKHWVAVHGDQATTGFDWRNIPLSSGDDYELCFTAPKKNQQKIEKWFSDASVMCTQIGVIEEQPGLRCLLSDGNEYHPVSNGYAHF